MPETSCRPVPPNSWQNAHCSAARCWADSRARGGRRARTLNSASPTRRSRAPKPSSQERSTAARLGVRLGQSRPDPARVGHRLGRRPCDRSARAVTGADPPASRQPDRADPQFTIRRHISCGHDTALRREFQLALHTTVFPARDLTPGPPPRARRREIQGVSASMRL